MSFWKKLFGDSPVPSAQPLRPTPTPPESLDNLRTAAVESQKSRKTLDDRKADATALANEHLPLWMAAIKKAIDMEWDDVYISDDRHETYHQAFRINDRSKVILTASVLQDIYVSELERALGRPFRATIGRTSDAVTWRDDYGVYQHSNVDHWSICVSW